MEVKTIKTFRMIVKHRNFQKAAEELIYAQSTLTMQIKKLEDELGARLLERGTCQTTACAPGMVWK